MQSAKTKGADAMEDMGQNTGQTGDEPSLQADNGGALKCVK